MLVVWRRLLELCVIHHGDGREQDPLEDEIGSASGQG